MHEAFGRFGQLVQEEKLEEAEKLLKEVLPSQLSEPKRKPGDLACSAYGLAWGRLVVAYTAKDDYRNAERVAAERVAAAEQVVGPQHMLAGVWLNMLGEIQNLQDRHDAAIAAFRRALGIYEAAGIGELVMTESVYNGLAEALLGKGEAAEAVALLKPLLEKPDSMFRSILVNTYAVALREAGEADEAGRGSAKEAGEIYQRLIAELENDQPHKEWDRALMAPLAAYARFLAAQGRGAEAAEVRARLQGIQKKYGIQGTIQ